MNRGHYMTAGHVLALLHYALPVKEKRLGNLKLNNIFDE
jgi:hypothetical protein